MEKFCFSKGICRRAGKFPFYVDAANERRRFAEDFALNSSGTAGSME
jgi:hypothetical protein